MQVRGLHCSTMQSEPPDPKLVTLLFNRAINARDLDGLLALMTEDHQFIDIQEHVAHGRDTMKAAWGGFFASFHDYRNVFETLTSREDRVIVLGRSVCSVADLAGPAIWTVRVRGDKVSEWRVYADDEKSRRSLRLAPGSLTLNA